MNGLFVSLLLVSFRLRAVFAFNRRAVMGCLASSVVCYEPSVEAGGSLHEATLLPSQLTESSDETQRRSYQGLGGLFTHKPKDILMYNIRKAAQFKS